jgi:predicted acylesterase/phospholipase RssA
MQQQDPQPGSSPEFDRLAVVTIQGGGIYGLNLLGQLAYMTETYKILPVAVAGNSAGAIVATLYWAGYHPSEILSEFSKLAGAQKLKDLIGPFNQTDSSFSLNDFRSFLKNIVWLFEKHMDNDKSGGWFRRRWEQFRKFDRFIRSIPTLISVRNRIIQLYDSRGCFQGDKFTEEIDRLIREGPLLKYRKEDLPTDRLIEFADVREIVAKDPKFNPPALFLTATNVTKRKLEVFNSIDPKYDHIPIAKAVRASAGFPVFFRPVEFKEDRYAGWYADGGIVSNYPAWIFSQAFRIRMLECSAYRQLAMRPWVHFGLRLERSPITEDPSSSDPKVYMSSLGRMLLGGESRSELEERLEKHVSHTYTILQPSDKQLPKKNKPGIEVPEDLLDINKLSKSLMEEMYRLGREESSRPGPLSFTLPENGVIEKLLEQLIDHVFRVFGKKDNTELQFRSNIFIPCKDELYIRYSKYMEKPAPGEENKSSANNDHDLKLQFDAGLTGACLTTRRPLLCNLQKLGQSDKELRDGLFGMPETMHNKVRKDRTWLASVPIFDPLASFPRELSIPTKLELPHRTAYSNCMAGRLDGAVMGVLNLDANIPYDTIEPRLDPDPEKHRNDHRISATLDLMTSMAIRIGEILSRNFAAEIKSKGEIA